MILRFHVVWTFKPTRIAFNFNKTCNCMPLFKHAIHIFCDATVKSSQDNCNKKKRQLLNISQMTLEITIRCHSLKHWIVIHLIRWVSYFRPVAWQQLNSMSWCLFISYRCFLYFPRRIWNFKRNRGIKFWKRLLPFIAMAKPIIYRSDNKSSQYDFSPRIDLKNT